MKEFTVLDVVPVNESYGDPKTSTEKYEIADIEVIRSDDFGVTDDSVIVRSHLGHILQPGDLVMGYDLRTTVWNNDELDKYSVGMKEERRERKKGMRESDYWMDGEMIDEENPFF